MLSRSTRERIDRYWAARLGCDSDALCAGGVSILAHGPGFRGWNGAYALRTPDGGVLLTVPHSELWRVQSNLNGTTPNDAFDAAHLEELFPRRERIVGPASLAYVDEETFARSPAPGVRELDKKDATNFGALRDDCDRTEWEHGDVVLGRNTVYGAFADGRIVAAASWDRRGDVANVGVVTHPGYRGRGLGRGVASAVTACLLDEGELPQWQTLVDNEASVAVGRALGYIELYRSIAIRL